ncbi:MAG: hypothetical protein ACOYJY_05965, partial [Acutalibacteraceae bacterium]
MNKQIIRLVSVGVCVLLTLGGVAAALGGFSSEKAASKPLSTAAPSSGDKDDAPTKDETVYVLAGADGTVKKIIVSDWIKNTLNSAKLLDQSELKEVENVKGDEGFTMGGANTRVWDAQGNDIYYQGEIDKELPVDLRVSYTLNGQPVTPDGLKGKSGKVSIRFDYDNKQYETVSLGGKQEKIYVPFAMLTGMLLDNDTFRNVEVSAGKLINDGSRTAVVGIAFPGLQEDLAIDEERLAIPDHVVITADVKNFSMGMTVTVATNEIFNAVDPDRLDSFDELHDSLDQLTGAMRQLLDGSSKLYDGLSALLDKSGELVAGIDQLAAGALQLKNGAGELDTGAGQLQTGAAQLADGLHTLAANNDTLNGGAKQVFDTLLTTAQTQLAQAGLTVPAMTVDNY